MAGNIENELSQLKEQIKLLERMVYLKNNVSSSEEYITKYMETQSKLSSMMKNYSMDSYNHEKKLVELLKQKAEIEEKRAKSAKERVNAEKESIKLEQETIRNKEKVQEHNEEIKKQNKEIVEQTKEMVEQTEELTEKEKERLEQKQKQDAQERLSYAFKSKSERAKEDLNKRQNEFAKTHPDLKGDKLVEELKKAGLVENKSNELIKDSLKSLKVGSKNVGELFSEGGKDISVGAGLISAGVQTFNKAVQVFSNAVHEGFKKQTGSYENNFTNIATMSGMSKETYRNNQMALGGFGKNILNEQGLMNNIRTSDVQDMWNSLATTGMNQSDILATALDNVITRTIVPYLDTTSESFNILNSRINGDFVKQIRGINKANLEISGNNYATKDVLDQLMKAVEPMSDEAIQNLAQGSEEVTSYINQLIDAGYTKDAATQKATNLFKMQKYGANDISSMGIADQLTYFKYLQDGTNIYDPNQFADAINGAVETDQWIAGLTLGYGDTTKGMITNTIGGSFGMDYASMNGALNLNKKGIKGSSLLANSKKADAGRYADEATKDLANDKLQTTKQLTDILAENLTNEVSAFAEMLGPWFDVLTTAVSGIATVLGAKLLGKVGGKIFGNGGSAGGAGFFSNFANGTAGTVGGTLGNGLMNIGLASGYSGGSVGAAQAIGAIPAVASVAGIAGGGYMMYDGVKKFTADDATAMDKGVATAEVLGGTAGVAGGVIVGSGVVAGLAGAGAANAWNPVGWGLLIAAGFTALGVAIYDGVKEQEKANKALEQTTENQIAAGKESKKEWEQLNQIYQNEYESRQNNLDEIELELDRGKDLESVKNQLIQTGLLSQEDVNGLRDKDADALKELITAYKGETARLSNEMQDFTDIAGDEDAKVEGSAKIGAVNWLKSHYKEGATDDNLAIIKSMVETAQNTAEGDRSDVQKELIKWYDWAMGDDTIQDYDVKQLFEGFTKIDLNKESSVNELKQQLTKKQIKKFSDGNTFGDKISEITNYNKKISDQAVNAQFATLYEKVISGATREEIVEGLNNIGYGPDTSVNAYKTMISKIRDYAKDHGMAEINWESGKGYFRTGTDSIPYDNYPAMLHEGEAVLTASTANELRGLIDEYRATKEDNIKLEKAIQDQTEALATRLDAIYNKIGNPDSDTSIMPRKFRQWKSNGR